VFYICSMSLLNRLPLLLTILFGFIQNLLMAQCEYHDESSALIRTLHQYHFAPLQDNTDNTARVIKQYLTLADPMHILYTETDFELILIQANHLLDTNDYGICQLIPFLVEIHDVKLKRFQNDLELWNPISDNFRDGKTFTFNQSIQKPYLHENDAQRSEHFYAILRLMTLMEAQNIAQQDSTINDQAIDYQQIITSHQIRIRANTQQALQCRINPDKEALGEAPAHEKIKHLLFDAIVSAQDAHSNFFDFEGIADYLGEIQSDEVSYGISIGVNEKNEKIIADLRPGSAAWRSNDIHINDQILAVYLDTKDIGSFDCMSASDLETMINVGTHRSIHLKLKTQSEKINFVTLLPEIVEIEENVLTSLILKKDSISIGYIALPSFFSSSDWIIDKGCANAVGTEILQLKKDNIQGLILDLRYNGGGDVSEAIELAGLFIDVGPIGLQKGQSEKPMILKEVNKGILYDGPLTILINNFSASASELVATALKDYNRALIVGHTTYGKGSAQKIFPIITAIESHQLDPLPIGFAKITTSMLYSIANKSYQAKGVVPDLELPNPFVHLGYSESNEPFSIQADSISKKLIYNTFPLLPIAELQKKSKIRLEQSTYFKALLENQEHWPRSSYQISLDPSKFESSIARMDAYIALNETLEKKMLCPFESHLASSYLELSKWDPDFSTLFEKNQINASYDAELHECFHIVADLIQLTTK
jgi:carboxyl-terminal processing protease